MSSLNDPLEGSTGGNVHHSFATKEVNINHSPEQNKIPINMHTMSKEKSSHHPNSIPILQESENKSDTCPQTASTQPMEGLGDTSPHRGNSTPSRAATTNAVTTGTKESPSATSGPAIAAAASEPGWRPSVNRRQSFVEQDMRHQLHRRFTDDLEKSNVLGFTETEQLTPA